MSDVTTGSAIAESPASAPAEAPSQPSTPSSPADNTAPTSFREAFVRAGDTPATPDPVSTTPPAAKADAPTTAAPPTEPAETAVATPKDEKKGPIPFDRHEAALKNAREKTEKEVEQRFRTQYADSLKYGEAFERDPVETYAKMYEVLAQHPEFGPKLKTRLGHGEKAVQPTAPTASEEPQPDFQTADGATFYSAAQLAKREQWLTEKITAEVKQSLIEPLTQKVEPLLTREQQRAIADRQIAREQAVTVEMKDLFDTYASQPYFKEHKDAIGERTLALMKEGKHPERAIGLAYTEIVLSKGVADRQQQLTAQAVAQSTGSTVQPGSVHSAPAKRPTNFRDAFAGIQD